jgi:predicted ATPase
LEPDWLPRLPLLNDVLQLAIPETSLTARLEGRTRSQAVVTLVTDILLKMAWNQPLVFSLEDTQWIDEVSEALTAALAQRLVVDPAPILLILVHRPLTDIDHPPMLLKVVTETYLHSRLELLELSPTEVFTIVERYLNAPIPPRLAQFVYSRAQGNPFFVRELLDTLMETGQVVVNDDQVQIPAVLEQSDLPPTVQGLIQARIDRLEELDKLTLKVASVIGREFDVRTLAESLPIQMDEEMLGIRLVRLQARDFVVVEEREGEAHYQFKHVITQEVTYQSLPFTQRKELHAAVAAALRKIAPDRVEALSYHYARAGPAAMPNAQKSSAVG